MLHDCLVHCSIREVLSGKKVPVSEEEEKVIGTIQKMNEKRVPNQKGPMSRPRKEILDLYRLLWELLPEAKDYYGYERLYIPSNVDYVYMDVMKDVAQMIHERFFHGKESYLPTIHIHQPAEAINLPDKEGKGLLVEDYAVVYFLYIFCLYCSITTTLRTAIMRDLTLQHLSNARQRRRQNKRAREEGEGQNEEGNILQPITSYPAGNKRRGAILHKTINNYGTNVRIRQW